MKNQKILYSILILFSILAIIGLFLPYASSTKEWRTHLEKFPDEINTEEANLINKDVVDISLFEYFKIYIAGTENFDSNNYLFQESLINLILIGLLSISSILILILAIFRRNIGIIIFSILLLISSLLLNYDITDRGALPTSKYDLGISFYLHTILAALCFVYTIVLIVIKRKFNKENTIK